MDSSMTISGQPSNTGVTTFVNEACEARDVLANYKPSSIAMAQSDLQDIKDYFARPRLIARGALTFGTRAQEFVQTINYTSLLAAFPQWDQRLSGVYGVRFTMNFRLQVAVTPFHQGLLALSWQYTTAGGQAYTRSGVSATATNIPHVRLDLSEMTMAELSIPFLFPYECLPVKTDTAQSTSTYGTVAINTILPCQSVSGLSAPTYELYAYLTDVELFGADNNNSSTITLQSGGVIKAEGRTHLLSDTLSAVSKVATYAKGIPLLSSIAGPTAWMTDIAAGVARYFGYSRPMIQDPPLRTIRGVYGSECNVDIPMAGFNNCLFQSNTLAVTPEFGGTDVDEMSLAYVLSQYSQICVGSVSNTDTHGKAIYATPMTPSVFWFRAPSSAPFCNNIFPYSSTVSMTGNAFVPSSLMYFASFFRVWRGSIKFRVTFAKTKFHGGRYLISFNPSSSVQQGTANWTTIQGPEVVSTLVQPYGYSMIMDLKDGNVFDFDVPYVCEIPYLGFGSSTGGLSIVCIDPLQSSASVTPTVPFVVEVAGGPDFEVADFAGPYFVSMPNGIIQQQSGTVATIVRKPNHITIGEEIKSVKQMIQVPWWTVGTVAAGTTNITTLPNWVFYHPSVNLAGSNSVPNSATLTTPGAGNTGAAIAHCYAWARGGTDIHVYATGPSDQVLLVVDQNPTSDLSSYSAPTTYINRPLPSATTKVVAVGNMPLHVRLPAFQYAVRYRSTIYNSLDVKVFAPSTSTSWQRFRTHSDRLIVRNDSSGSVKVVVARAAADDAALAHYMGPVPVYIPNAANTNAIDSDWNP